MDNPASTYNDWKRLSTDVGCVFARKIAFNPAQAGQEISIVQASSTAARVATSLDKTVVKMQADARVDAAAVILPGVQELEFLLAVAIALKSKPDWSVVFSELQDSKIGPAIAVGISRLIPASDGSKIPSEALVLGPFPEFPLTRRAPVTAIELFVGTPKALDPKTQLVVTKANLAHLTIRLPNDHAFGTMWDRSVAGRLASLGGVEDSRAKAKVSFVVPRDMAKSAGCLP